MVLLLALIVSKHNQAWGYFFSNWPSVVHFFSVFAISCSSINLMSPCVVHLKKEFNHNLYDHRAL